MIAAGRTHVSELIAVACVALTLAGCGKSTPPVVRPTQPPPAEEPLPPRPAAPAPPARVTEAPIVPPEPALINESINSASLDDLNRTAPLAPVFFELDSAEISGPGQKVLADNAALLKQNGTWVVTIEGHCDERGSAEYNLALGERRALAARAYLVSLGIAPDRLRTVSYGNEFPFDPGHDEGAFGKNRRAHFVITAK
jgi:peptidoglycan-associated lipoprotein